MPRLLTVCRTPAIFATQEALNGILQRAATSGAERRDNKKRRIDGAEPLLRSRLKNVTLLDTAI
jgi:hypothetical protein